MLLCFPAFPQPGLEFSSCFQTHGLGACADFMSAAGTLFPMALWGRCQL